MKRSLVSPRDFCKKFFWCDLELAVRVSWMLQEKVILLRSEVCGQGVKILLGSVGEGGQLRLRHLTLPPNHQKEENPSSRSHPYFIFFSFFMARARICRKFEFDSPRSAMHLARTARCFHHSNQEAHPQVCLKIMFISMFNDIEWTKKGDNETCLHSVAACAIHECKQSSTVMSRSDE